MVNVGLAAVRIGTGKAGHPCIRRSVLGKSRIAQSTRSILRNSKRGESFRTGHRVSRRDSSNGPRDLRKGAERLAPISVPEVVFR